jgi:hypothetical protein
MLKVLFVKLPLFKVIIHLGRALNNPNCTHKGPKSRLLLGSACYPSVKNVCPAIYYPKTD